MSACPSCDCPLVIPPPYKNLAIHYPHIRPSINCDRSISRCKECDRAAAEKRVADAVLPPPYYINPVAQIKKQIDLAQDLIRADIRREELERELPAMKRKWVKRVYQRDANVRSAWHGYWEIWGWEEGQPRMYGNIPSTEGSRRCESTRRSSMGHDRRRVV